MHLAAAICICFGFAAAELLPLKTYTVAEGLLRDEVGRIKFDSRGFLWLCSTEGLSRFDGSEFTNFTTADGLPDRHVNDLLETRSGEYWIATDAGLVRMNPRGIRGSSEDPLFTVVGKVTPAVMTIHEANDGRLWVGTREGLFRLDDQMTLEPVDLGPLPGDRRVMIVSSIISDGSGTVWVAAELGLYRIFHDGRVAHYDSQHGLPATIVSSLMKDDRGRLWIGMRDAPTDSLARLTIDPISGEIVVERVFTQNDGLISNWVLDVFQSSDGQVWLATPAGLCQVENDEKVACRGYQTTNNPSDAGVYSIAEDREQNLWFATRNGTKKLSRYGFTSYFVEDGLAYPVANSIFENTSGELFVSAGSNGRPVSRFDGRRFSFIRPNIPTVYTGWGWKQTVVQDRENGWWFPTGRGLYRFPSGTRFEDLSRAKPVKISLGGEDKEIFRIYEDSRGDIWAATWASRKELWRWERQSDRWVDHTGDAAISTRFIDVTSFVEDRSGNLWIGTGSDYRDTILIRYRDGRFKTFSNADDARIAGWLRDLYIDNNGSLWIASTTSGLLRLDDVNGDQLKFVQYTAATGLSSNGIYCVTEDRYGRIYAGSARGVDRLEPGTGRIENFTTNDGLPRSYVEIAFRDINGNLWFGTSNGLARLVPEPMRARNPPKAFISGFRASGISQPVSILGETVLPTVHLEAGQRQVTIDFFGLGANVGEKLSFEYRIRGSDWIATKEHSVNFGSMAAGDHVFEVRAVTADGLTSEPAIAAFSIAAPIWQRWWFIMLAAAGVATSIYFVYRARISRLLEIERVRTRIATDLHDDIGANLTRISLLSEVAGRHTNGGNGKMLSSIAEIARESVASMNDIVWAVSPEHDSLGDLVSRMRRHAEEVFSARSITLDFRTVPLDPDLKLTVGTRRDLLLIFKEAVNNAARHSGCTHVTAELRMDRDKLSLTIADDGGGFDPLGEHEGHGMSSMESRARRLGGIFKVRSNPGSGTTIEFTMPA